MRTLRRCRSNLDSASARKFDLESIQRHGEFEVQSEEKDLTKQSLGGTLV